MMEGEIPEKTMNMEQAIQARHILQPKERDSVEAG